MINLLPPTLKQSYRIGRINSHLVRWITACLIGIVGAAGITIFGYLYLNEATENYVKQTAITHKQLTDQNLKGVQNEVKEISNNLSLVVNVLSKQVLFSELLSQLSKLLPADTRLSALAISQSQGAVDISATAASYAAATQLQVNLRDPTNKLFSKADIITVNCSNAAVVGYPCSVTIRALFAPNNTYMLSNLTKAAGS